MVDQLFHTPRGRGDLINMFDMGFDRHQDAPVST